MNKPISLTDIEAAQLRLAGAIHETPLLRSPAFSVQAGCDLYLKAENLQLTGSFKLRGALNKIALLTEAERMRGVVAASMGNHAQGVAYAARQFGVAAQIVMPATSSLTKYQATRDYGADVVLFGETVEQCIREARRIEAEQGPIFIHPYDDLDVIAGQGTIGLEMLRTLPETDVVVVPVGGGGLIAGIAVAVKMLKPSVRVIGVQAATCAPFPPALAVGRPLCLPSGLTIADGIRVLQPGEKTFALVQEYVDDIVTVNDEEIGRAIVQLIERQKLVVEGAGAAAVAAVVSGKCGISGGSTVVAVLAGGNIDVSLIGRLLDYGLATSGRLLMVELTMLDVPNELLRFLTNMQSFSTNITQIEHFRGEMTVPVGYVKVLMRLETKDAQQQEAILSAMTEHHYQPRRVGPERPSVELV